MPLKCIVTRGLPGSGKTTFAKQYLLDHPSTVRVNKDDLRALLHGGKHSKGRETFVLAVRDFVIDKALSEGHDCVVDDTNFHSKHLARIEEIAAKHNATVDIQDFTDVPLEVCIARDLQRANSVGERVIRQMHRQYLETKPTPPVYDDALPSCVICDLDGTLALFGDANPYDRDFSKDEVNKVVSMLLYQQLLAGAKIFIFSGRKECYREQTMAWLPKAVPKSTSLHMRGNDDNRKDDVLKEELYNQHVRGKYNVRLIVDDRLSVCRLWYRLGLPLFRVGDPDADF